MQPTIGKTFNRTGPNNWPRPAHFEFKFEPMEQVFSEGLSFYPITVHRQQRYSTTTVAKVASGVSCTYRIGDAQ